MTSRSERPQTIWLCRHGNRIDFVDPLWKGVDPYLSIDGVVQAKKTGLRLKNEGIQHMFASPFLRAVETAHYIAEVLDLQIKIEHGVTEWLNPQWFSEPPAYVPVGDMHSRFPRVDDKYESVLTPEYPENVEDALLRAGETARILADTFKTDILIVGHGYSIIGMARALVRSECSISVGFCALVKVIRQPDRATIVLNGDASHLSDRETRY